MHHGQNISVILRINQRNILKNTIASCTAHTRLLTNHFAVFFAESLQTNIGPIITHKIVV